MKGVSTPNKQDGSGAGGAMHPAISKSTNVAVSPFFKRVKSPASDVSSPRPLNLSQDGEKIRRVANNISDAAQKVAN